MVAYSPAAQVCHLDSTEVMLFADQRRRSLGGAAAYGMAIDPGGVTALQNSVLAQPPVISCIESKGPAERYAAVSYFWIRKWAPSVTNVVLVLGVLVVTRFLKY